MTSQDSQQLHQLHPSLFFKNDPTNSTNLTKKGQKRSKKVEKGRKGRRSKKVEKGRKRSKRSKKDLIEKRERSKKIKTPNFRSFPSSAPTPPHQLSQASRRTVDSCSGSPPRHGGTGHPKRSTGAVSCALVWRFQDPVVQQNHEWIEASQKDCKIDELN